MSELARSPALSRLKCFCRSACVASEPTAAGEKPSSKTPQPARRQGQTSVRPSVRAARGGGARGTRPSPCRPRQCTAATAAPDNALFCADNSPLCTLEWQRLIYLTMASEKGARMTHRIHAGLRKSIFVVHSAGQIGFIVLFHGFRLE